MITREDIKNAAMEFAYKTGETDFNAFSKGFYNGVRWRIDSVWHDMKKEVPQVYGEYENKVAPSIPCLVKGDLSTGYGYGVRYWNVSYEVWDDEQADDYECDKDKIECWAYLDDLLPNAEMR